VRCRTNLLFLSGDGLLFTVFFFQRCMCPATMYSTKNIIFFSFRLQVDKIMTCKTYIYSTVLLSRIISIWAP